MEYQMLGFVIYFNRQNYFKYYNKIVDIRLYHT